MSNEDAIVVTFTVPRNLSDRDRAALKEAGALYDGPLHDARPEDPGIVGGFGALHFAIQAVEWGTSPEVTRAWEDLHYGAVYPLGQYAADVGPLYVAYESAVEKGNYDPGELAAARATFDGMVAAVRAAMDNLDAALAADDNEKKEA